MRSPVDPRLSRLPYPSTVCISLIDFDFFSSILIVCIRKVQDGRQLGS